MHTQRNKNQDTGAEGEGGKDIVDTRRTKKDRVNTDWRASKPCHIERDYGYCKRKDCGFKHTKPHGPHIQVNSTIVADNQESKMVAIPMWNQETGLYMYTPQIGRKALCCVQNHMVM